jgi:hypothetical protein
MLLDEPWVWLAGVAAGWVFLGLVASRFNGLRRAMGGSARPIAISSSPRTGVDMDQSKI